jgi:hypothetical protein
VDFGHSATVVAFFVSARSTIEAGTRGSKSLAIGGGPLINLGAEPIGFGEHRGLHQGVATEADLAGDSSFDAFSFAFENEAGLANLNVLPVESGQLIHSGLGPEGVLHISTEGRGSDGPNSLWLQYDHDSGQIWLNLDSDGDMHADVAFDVSDDFASLLTDLQPPLSEPPAW